MQVISFVTQKGGSGKSTLAASCAVRAIECGHKVFVLEMDRQGTLSDWTQQRTAEQPEFDQIGPEKLEPGLTALRHRDYDLVIIDTPGVDNPGTAAAIRAADLCLIPCRPSPADVRATRPTLAAITRLDKPFAFILNQCPPRSPRVNETIAGLGLLGIVADATIVMRTDHQDAIGLGLGVTELNPEGAAANEIRTLWTWIERKLGNRTVANVAAA